MNREQFLGYAAGIYGATRSVMKAVPPGMVQHRPRPEMMSIAQLIRHTASACASPIGAMLKGDFPKPEGGELKLPTVEEMEGYDTVQEALDHLARDEKQLRELIMRLGEEEFQTREVHPPWLPKPVPVWLFSLMMLDHLSSHRVQLFQYLKSQGLPVNTMTLWGVG
ncbi:DinB family protein [Candidatus Sumerlaeota bacterium]|nr:DinB family protein [Candidatus Sumerlaeota bacterium]